MYDWGFSNQLKAPPLLDSKPFISFSLSFCFLIFSLTSSAVLFVPDLTRVFQCTLYGLWLILFCLVFKFSSGMLLLWIHFFSYFNSCTSYPIFHLICSVVMNCSIFLRLQVVFNVFEEMSTRNFGIGSYIVINYRRSLFV